MIAMNNVPMGPNHATGDSTSTPTSAQANQYQDETLFGRPRGAGVDFQKMCLSPIPEIVEELV